MPKRIQLRRTKGWRKPEGAVVVARPSKWGNPYHGGREDDPRLARELVDRAGGRPRAVGGVEDLRMTDDMIPRTEAQMPERIWARPDSEHGWLHGHASDVLCDEEGAEYVRADAARTEAQAMVADAMKRSAGQPERRPAMIDLPPIPGGSPSCSVCAYSPKHTPGARCHLCGKTQSEERRAWIRAELEHLKRETD